MSDASEFTVILKSRLAELHGLERETAQLRAEAACYRAQAEHYQSALAGLAERNQQDAEGAAPTSYSTPRQLAATCDALRVRIVRLEDEVASRQRELDTFREILQALGSLCRTAPTPTPPPLFTAGAEQEDAEEPEDRVQWRRSAPPAP